MYMCLCLKGSSVIVKHLCLDGVTPPALLGQCQDGVVDRCHLHCQRDWVLVLAGACAVVLVGGGRPGDSGQSGALCLLPRPTALTARPRPPGSPCPAWAQTQARPGCQPARKQSGHLQPQEWPFRSLHSKRDLLPGSAAWCAEAVNKKL